MLDCTVIRILVIIENRTGKAHLKTLTMYYWDEIGVGCERLKRSGHRFVVGSREGNNPLEKS